MNTVLVGRERELARGVELLEGLRHGHGAVYCLEGGPGMGKTELAQRIVARAWEAGRLVLNGSLTDGQELPGLWPWKRVLSKCRKIIEAPGADPSVAALRSGHAPLLENLETPWSEIPELGGLPESGRKYRVYEWIGRFLEELSRVAPLVLVLEDLHNSDDASLHLLEYLLDELEYAPVYFLLTWRPGEGRGIERLERMKGRLEFVDRRAWSFLAELSREDIRSYLQRLDRPSDDHEVDQVLAWTGGVPLRVALYVQTVRDGLPGNSSLQLNQLYWLQVRRGLSAAARETLLRLAVVGSGFTEGELRALVPLDELLDDDSPESVREELVRACLVKQGADGGFYKFFHDEFRKALLEPATEEERRSLVAAVAAVLEELAEASLERSTYLLKELYLAAGDRASARKGVEYTLRAVEYAKQQNAWAEVTRDLERLLEHYRSELTESEYRAIQFDLCVASVREFRNPRPAGSSFLEVVRYYQGARDWQRVIELIGLAGARFLVFTADGESIMRELLEGLPQDHPRRSELLCAYGELLIEWRNRFEEGWAVLGEAVATGIRTRNAAGEVRARAALALYGGFARRFEESLASVEEILGGRRGEPDLESRVIAHLARALCLLGLGRMAECRGALHDALRNMTLYQHPFWWVIARRDLQRFALRAGDWAEVRSYEWDDPAFFFFRIPIVVASYLTGDIAAGDRAIENLLEIESNGDSQTHQMMNTMLTWLQAVRVYVTGEERWLRDCEKRTVRGCEQAGNQRHLAQYSICGGRIVRFALNEEQARAFYRTLREAERYYFEEEEYSIAAAKALLALKWGDADLARQHFQEAVAFCDKYEEKPWRAWYLYELARLLEGQEPGRAQALAEEALLEARRLGLNPLVQRIESEQASGARRLAGAIGAADARRELGITSREQEVLALLVRGLTDKEIAAELALSPFTVSNHLRNIYAKIGCNTRGEAVHWALSCGLVAVE